MSKNIYDYKLIYSNMATVPDPLETDNVTFLAYYNLSSDELSQTLNTEDLNFGSVEEDRFETQPDSEIYDNGVRLKIYDNHVDRTFILRAGNKDHKWITAHMVTDDYPTGQYGKFTQNTIDTTDISDFYITTSSESDYTGDYDLMKWNNRNSAYDISQNNLFKCIEKSLSSTGYWNKSNLSLDRAGLYDYSISNDHNISVFSHNKTTDNEMDTYGYAFTDDTTIYKALTCMRAYHNYIYINGENIGYPNGKGQVCIDVTEIVKQDKEISFSRDGDDFSIHSIVVWS